MEQIEERLVQSIEKITSPYHCVAIAKEQFLAAGFEEISLENEWKLQRGKAYFVNIYDSSFLAFRINENYEKKDGFRLSLAHTDFPGFRIKSNPDMKEGNYHKLNIEVYGGPILSTWLDRPLSVAGRVVLRGKNTFSPEVRLVDFMRPIMTIPNLAPHLDKEGNSKAKDYNRQLDLMPLYGMIENALEQMDFVADLANEMGVKKEDILDFELGLYVYEKAELLGIRNEFLQGPRLDNITSVQGCVSGLIEGRRSKGIDLVACFDHEEVGSRSKKGAGSFLLSHLIKKIYQTIHGDGLEFLDAMLKSICLSVDVAHAHHPNKVEKSDLTNKNYINHGVVIKTAYSQAYVSEGVTTGIIIQLCEKANIPYQRFFNRSDISGGSTLGAIISASMPLPSQDIGVAVLAMHSARETMGVKDQAYLQQLLTVFYSLEE